LIPKIGELFFPRNQTINIRLLLLRLETV